MAVAAELLAASISEDELQTNVTRLCKMLGLRYYHTHDSRRSPEGFPDLTIVKGDALLFRELKNETRKPTPAQLQWLAGLSDVRRVSAGLWRPRDWLSGEIERALRSAG
jgi:hypothetical protein